MEKIITEDLCQAKELITQARSFCNAPGGPYLYDEALQSDLILIREAEEKPPPVILTEQESFLANRLLPLFPERNQKIL